jgi:hypothetical protein
MVLEHYISELLYRYNCVVIPQFGAFLAHEVSARINTTTHTFFAPSKALAFNGQLTANDGLLVSYIAQAEKTAYETVLAKINATVADWTALLERGEKLALPQLGTLWHNAEGNIQFDPAQEVNYLTASFGLANLHSLPVVREELRQEVVALEEKIPFVISPEVRESGGLRPYMKYAAILLLALSTGLTGYRMYQQGRAADALVDQKVRQQVTKQIQEATFFDAQPMELPAVSIASVSLGATSKENANHHIIAGAFRYRANAERKIKQLQQEGFPAAYYGTNAHGLHMVSYDRHENASDALVALRQIKKEHSTDAWLLSEK